MSGIFMTEFELESVRLIQEMAYRAKEEAKPSKWKATDQTEAVMDLLTSMEHIRFRDVNLDRHDASRVNWGYIDRCADPHCILQTTRVDSQISAAFVVECEYRILLDVEKSDYEYHQRARQILDRAIGDRLMTMCKLPPIYERIGNSTRWKLTVYCGDATPPSLKTRTDLSLNQILSS